MLSLAMLVTCGGYLTYLLGVKYSQIKLAYYAFGIVIPFDVFVHWMFCSIYMKLSLEVKYLLDIRIYMDNEDLMEKFDDEKTRLNQANGVAVFICLCLVAYECIDRDINGLNIASLISGFIQIGFLTTWTCTLYFLFKHFEGSKKVLPHKGVFITHAFLLGMNLLTTLYTVVMKYVSDYMNNCDTDC